MHTCIDADLVAANLMAFHNKQVVSIRALNKFKELLESLLQGRYLYVDVCSGSICMAVDNRPDMFYWDDEGLHRRDGCDPKFFTMEYVEKHFNWRIPKRVRTSFDTACRLSGHILNQENPS
jgi:hypothetical protein